MGLDSYVLRIKKAQGLMDRVYTVKELRQQDIDYIRKEDVNELAEQLLPYCKEIRVKAGWYDMEKIRKDFELSETAYICMQDGNGNIGVFDPEREANSEVHISREQVDAGYTVIREEPYYVFMTEEVAYWRKNYAVQDFFYEHVDEVANTGFYLLDPDVLKEFNEEAQANWGYLPVEDPTEESALFYHEWY